MSDTLAHLRIALLATLALVVSAFAAAYLAQDSGMLSLTPPPSDAIPNPSPDALGKELALYASAFTAWAALLLLIPAYISVWFKTHYQNWLAFWTTSYIAYIIHLAVSMFWFFEGDFSAMTSSTRVSAFWPGMVIVLWWGLDIALAGTQAKWVTVQRVMIHVLVFVLFVGGSAVKGETALIQLMGWALFGTGLGALVVAMINRRNVA